MKAGWIRQSAVLLAVGSLAFASIAGEPAALFGDLGSLNPVRLSKEQLEQLLPGAKMSRKISTGSTHYWTNDSGGTLVISTDGRGRVGTSSLSTPSLSPGKWHISPDGRYCVTIDWQKAPTEDWCRYVFETGDGYYASKTDHDLSEKVYRLQINGR